MKNVHELYEKYYNAYKIDYHADELSEAKKKKIDYRQKLTLDEETKKKFKEIKNSETIVDKKKFREHFSYELTALINELLGQNTWFKKKFGWD